MFKQTNKRDFAHRTDGGAIKRISVKKILFRGLHKNFTTPSDQRKLWFSNPQQFIPSCFLRSVFNSWLNRLQFFEAFTIYAIFSYPKVFLPMIMEEKGRNISNTHEIVNIIPWSDDLAFFPWTLHQWCCSIYGLCVRAICWDCTSMYFNLQWSHPIWYW